MITEAYSIKLIKSNSHFLTINFAESEVHESLQPIKPFKELASNVRLRIERLRSLIERASVKVQNYISVVDR